ncbi:hypothetical protein DPMN_129542 [Dreissena polymorpha]|uniref:Uncharacterized protein n=1 Tax=Dreissena polymorpha TaxID=45954 RepID=A0A9D4H2V2_DREPO|nr:hypothetical protein DPMN_129542 [Dreissena polymorpha]
MLHSSYRKPDRTNDSSHASWEETEKAHEDRGHGIVRGSWLHHDAHGRERLSYNLKMFMKFSR